MAAPTPRLLPHGRARRSKLLRPSALPRSLPSPHQVIAAPGNRPLVASSPSPVAGPRRPDRIRTIPDLSAPIHCPGVPARRHFLVFEREDDEASLPRALTAPEELELAGEPPPTSSASVLCDEHRCLFPPACTRRNFGGHGDSVCRSRAASASSPTDNSFQILVRLLLADSQTALLILQIIWHLCLLISVVAC